jgi:hypothetical protein
MEWTQLLAESLSQERRDLASVEKSSSSQLRWLMRPRGLQRVTGPGRRPFSQRALIRAPHMPISY